MAKYTLQLRENAEGGREGGRERGEGGREREGGGKGREGRQIVTVNQ